MTIMYNSLFHENVMCKNNVKKEKNCDSEQNLPVIKY